MFFLRFRSQLRRTNPRVVEALEDRVLALIREAGGVEKPEHRMVGAVFNEAAIGLGLDMLDCIDAVMDYVESRADELFGYALLIGRDIPEDGERICRCLSSPGRAGIYCDEKSRELLSYYLLFEAPVDSSSLPDGAGAFSRISVRKPLEGLRAPLSVEAEQSRRSDIVRSLKQGRGGNTLVTGPEFFGKRAGLYEFAGGGAPPLAVHFGSGIAAAAGRGPAALLDAYSPEIHRFLADAAGSMAGDQAEDAGEELEFLRETLFQDRLQGEFPPLRFNMARRFFSLLLAAYTRAAGGQKLRAVLILENIDKAAEGTARIVQEVLAPYASRHAADSSRPPLEIYGTASPGGAPVDPSWDQIFHRIIRREGAGGGFSPDMSRDLWEICYAFTLLGRYFPGYMFPQLLAEGGKSSRTIIRALDMLINAGLVDNPQDPRPRIKDFLPQAESILGERKALVRRMVRNRLLDWVFARLIHPCFPLLDALAALDGGAAVFETIKRGDELILKSIVMDMAKGYPAGFEEARKTGRLESIVGPQRALTVEFLIHGFRALLAGNKEDIKEAFRCGLVEDRIYPPFKAQTLANIGAYFLGIRDADSAQDAVREAFLLSQNAPWSGLAQSNRLLSLVNIFKQRMGETVEYAGFAVENAEKFGNYEELPLALFYDAAVQFLHGNISQAQQSAEAAEIQAKKAGLMEWADRARFFRGKLAFDLGFYQDALQFFQDIAGSPAGNPSPEKMSLLEAWAYRARIYSQTSFLPGPGGNIDAELFKVEGAYLAGDYSLAADLAGDLAAALSETLPDELFIYTEQPDWRSGFSQCELLLLPPREIWGRMAAVYYALSLCRSSPKGRAEALGIMQRALRDERLSDADPWDSFYYYAWYQVLQESGAPQVDMNTAISMAFKQLQRRASRINDIKARQTYLTQPRWNGALSMAARKHRLI
ncbi:MAG: hypothetical protein LBH51_07470 [Treponema sp.]|nr:hypothetical protein [Treponema sp.]